MSLWTTMDDTQCFFHNESVRDDVTPIPDRIMQKTGLWSSGSSGSQDNTAWRVQHTTNHCKPDGELTTKLPTRVETVYY